MASDYANGRLVNYLILFFMSFVFLALGGIYLYLSHKPPAYITDPSHVDFNINDFHFKNYGSKKSLSNALKVLFPVGTPKTTVDEVLGKFSIIRDRNSYHSKYKDKILVVYTYDGSIKSSLKMAISKFVYLFIYVPRPPDSWPSHYVVIRYDLRENLEHIKVVRAI